MTERKCVNHPDRPHRARGLCGSCYVTAQRKGALPPRQTSYVDELIEEVETVGLTWDQAEEMFGRKRTTISNALYRRKEHETIRSLQANTYGTTGRANINSALPKVMPRESYQRALVEDLEYHPDWTWDDACAKFDRSRADLYAVLKRAKQEGLIKRLNTNSGIKDISPYLDDIVRFMNTDSDLTWDVLCGLLGKKPKTVRQYLLRRDRRDLVERLDGATRKGC